LICHSDEKGISYEVGFCLSEAKILVIELDFALELL